MSQWKPFAVSLLIPLALGGLAAALTGPAFALYEGLARPALSPPGPVFPTVWTLLYLLMGTASWLVWKSRGTFRKEGLCLYGIQLVLQFCWSLTFFRCQNFALGLFWIALLWVTVLLTTARFFLQNRLAGGLMIPYGLWVLFAGYLNAGILFLN